MTNSPRPGVAPTRRALLARGLALLSAPAISGAMAGCTSSSGAGAGSSATARSPSPDESAAARTVLTTRSLLASEDELTGDSRVGSVIAAIAASHRVHLAQLGLPDLDASPSPPQSPPRTPPRTPPPSTAPSGPVPASRGAGLAPATAATGELAAADETLADVLLTTPTTAGLLARIAAARAVHADLLTAAAGLNPPGEPQTPTTPWDSLTARSLDDATITAFATLLAGEHAAVFAYGLITARAPRAREPSARSLWAAHRARRDELERHLLAVGRTPVAALPAYDVGRLPTTPDQLTAFAAGVEDRMAAAAVSAVTDATGTLRGEAALDLVHAARRAADWRGTIDPLPGALT